MIQVNDQDSIKDVLSPIPGLGWLNQDSWASLRQQNSPELKLLSPVPSRQTAKTLKIEGPSDVRTVGEGIFLNRKAAEKEPNWHNDRSMWEQFVARALLYRVNPDFESPFGNSGIALYADGIREDGIKGPGVAGFQSFVQRSGHVQTFAMEGDHLEKRLQQGRVAFYGAFQVPEKLRKDWRIM